MSLRRVVCLTAATTVAGAAAMTGAGANGVRDHAAQAWNVLPPGQAGGVAFTKNSTDQIALYEGLTRLRGNVTDADLRRFFKRETLGLAPGDRAVRVERPRKGVTITRDRWGVPHVKGATAEDVAFGAGWATAADRQLLMELFRGPGRIAALDAPGVDPLAFALSGRTFRPSARTEAALARQFDLLRARGEAGRRAIRIVDAYVAGINAQYRKAGLALAPWTRIDVVAVGGLIGSVFGAGGGDEVRRSRFLDALQRKLGAEQGRRVWEDLRQRGDPEARVAVPAGATARSAQSEIGNVVVDSSATPGPAPRTTRLSMSNALLVGARRSVTGKPLFVAGPQVGHYYPGLLLELDLEGGGYRARGVAFPGISFAILMGRGIDYAWSATSAGSDLVDQYVETLCGGSDTAYFWNGECREMTTFDAGTIVGRPGEQDRPLVYRETVHGPVTGYATVEGKRVAISVKRSTRGRELASLPFFLELSRNEIRSARDFVRAASRMELAFNWLYADHRDIAQFTSGRLPVRPSTVDHGLPTKGTGEYEWRGFAPAAAHAQAISPPSGLILNWNNKPSRALPTGGRRVDVGVRTASRSPLDGNREAREAHARERRRGDERRGDPGPPRAQSLARRARRARAWERHGARVSGGGACRRVARDRWQPARRRPRREDRRVRSSRARRVLGTARGCRARTGARPGAARGARDARRHRAGAPRERLERLQRLVVVRAQGSPLAPRSHGAGGISRRGSAVAAT